MSTTVTFAGNLAEDPELLYTHDQETDEKRTKNVVVDNRFGEVGVSLKYRSARIERTDRAAAQAS
ncbi:MULTISPECIES: hypothetical protein [unclassified Nocardioides]|uniref:hypothetical protein n=1 Tax=unclassified Nocardioides TaxID=2615069 RepID=UPI000046573A|nr:MULTISPECIES: hypothetical protein [unclassified Nocardioides]AAV52097.1 hypothetical protein [Nocardioides sp. JS614]ABL79379.1 hypothetical protein Noca_4795 [Nocardioides sp. JS614]